MFKTISHYFPSHTLPPALLDGALLFLAALLVITVYHAGVSPGSAGVLLTALLYAVVVVVLNSVTGLYRIIGIGASRSSIIKHVAFAVLVSTPPVIALLSLSPGFQVTDLHSMVVLVGWVVLVACVRGLLVRYRGSAVFLPRVLIIGTGDEALDVSVQLSEPYHHGVKVVGFVPVDDNHAVDKARWLNSERGLLALAEAHKVDEIIVAVRERRGGVLPIRDLLECKLHGVRVSDLSSFFERIKLQVPVDSLKASWLIYGDGFRQGLGRGIVKRVFDIVIALILLILALPVMLVTALLIVLEDRGPVFYRQERVGLGGRIFKVTKFRSMRTDAEKDGKAKWATRNDDRITRVGRFIRKVCIDELPQLINVLGGSMSLVGPRPERPVFVDQFSVEIPFYTVRHSVKPGVTGWAQVRYQYGSSVDDSINKLQYDLYYVKNHTLMLDLFVLIETIRVVITGEGAQ